jgi:hypothetical protein
MSSSSEVFRFEGYTNDKFHCDIPEGKTTIGRGAFIGFTTLKSIKIARSVTTIEYSAFMGCSELGSIRIPDTCTTINRSAFIGCAELQRKADEAGLSIVEMGRLNWRNLQGRRCSKSASSRSFALRRPSTTKALVKECTE